MGATKEYFLKLQEEEYNRLSVAEKIRLNTLGLVTKQVPNEEDLKDENVKKLNKNIASAYEEREKYLFKKRNK